MSCCARRSTRIDTNADRSLTTFNCAPTVGSVNPLLIKPERLAELEELARRRGTTTAEALDEALAAYLDWERQDHEEAVAGIRQGYQDVKVARTKPADLFLDDLRRKHDLQR
jgi:hypothetical protein